MRTARPRKLVAILALVAATLGASTVAASGAPTRTAQPAERAALTDAQPTMPLGHVGRWLTDADGRVVFVHGVNYVIKTPGVTPAAAGFGADDAAWIADNGFDIVRLGTTAASIMPTPGVVDTAYVDSFAATVQMLTDHGLMVLVDLHQDGWGPTLGANGFPEWMTITHGAENTGTPFPLFYITNPAIQAAFQSFWNNENGTGGTPLQTSAATMWDALSASVASNPGVIGYDLINEPWPGTTWNPCATDPAGCPVQDAALDAFNTRMTTAIRANDPSRLVFPEPYVLFNFGAAPTNINLPGGDTNSGMSWHMYPLNATAPTAGADEMGVINHALAWSSRTGGALLNTEWGALTNPAIIKRQAGELDDAMLPWIYWAYNEGVQNDLSVSPSASTAAQPVTDAMIRPHPLAVAGTPISQHFDPATDTLSYQYSTRRADGTDSFEPGAVTSFQVQQHRYPNGYQVTVDGGHVTSAPGARLLTVVAEAGAQTVSVTVSPVGSPVTPTPTPTGPTGPTTPPATAVTRQPTYTG